MHNQDQNLVLILLYCLKEREWTSVSFISLLHAHIKKFYFGRWVMDDCGYGLFFLGGGGGGLDGLTPTFFDNCTM